MAPLEQGPSGTACDRVDRQPVLVDQAGLNQALREGGGIVDAKPTS